MDLFSFISVVMDLVTAVCFCYSLHVLLLEKTGLDGAFLFLTQFFHK